MKTPWDIHYEAFLDAGGIYTEKHARLYADLANDLMADGSFSILYEGVAHACTMLAAITRHMKWAFLFQPMHRLIVGLLVNSLKAGGKES